MIFSLALLLSSTSYGDSFSQNITSSFANDKGTLQEFEHIEANKMGYLRMILTLVTLARM